MSARNEESRRQAAGSVKWLFCSSLLAIAKLSDMQLQAQLNLCLERPNDGMLLIDGFPVS
jgi:hypothetical protein